jgi:hypothetical protein
MASINGTRRIVISTVGLAAASVVTGAMMVVSVQTASATPTLTHGSTVVSESSPAPTMDPDMPGMDMGGSTPAEATAPAPTMDPDMPGMDMGGSTPAEATAPAPTMDPDMPGMDMPGMDHEHGGAAEVAAHRPLAPVLGTFGGGSAAVLLTAGMLRRKDRAASLAKRAARLAGRAKK